MFNFLIKVFIIVSVKYTLFGYELSKIDISMSTKCTFVIFYNTHLFF